ncbi:MAG: NAD(P)-dependent glycerol-1-phosphate dehydrogenase [Methanobacteriota archaeon]
MAQMDGFEKFKVMELPRSVVVGHDALGEVGRTCKALGLNGTALVICDSVTVKIAGDRVSELLREAGYCVEHLQITEADEPSINGAMEAAKSSGARFMLGVGGGRPIDVAKCASFNLKMPFLSVPTAASHDGIVSSRASVINAKGRKESLSAHPPLALVADTGIICRAPARLLAAGCGDIISNYTAVLDWKLAHRIKHEYFSSYAASLSEMTARLLIEQAESIKPGLEESAWFVVKALVSSGVAMSIAGSSRPASGAEHAFSHKLDEIAATPALHGEQCGVGSIMMMYLHGGDWQGIRNALKAVGAPTMAKEIGIAPDEVVQALCHAHEVRPERYTILGDNGLTLDAAENLAKSTKVI